MPDLCYDSCMTMNDRIEALLRRIVRTRNTQPIEGPQPTTELINTLVTAIYALSTALDVPHDVVPSMIDLAYDNVLRTDLPSNDALFYAFLLNVFTLYPFRDDTFDELMSIISPS